MTPTTTSTKRRFVDIRYVGKLMTLWELSEHLRLSKAEAKQKQGEGKA